MLSRTAENLYWLARYVERAEYLARTIDATLRATALPSAYVGKSNEWESAVYTAGVEDGFFKQYKEADEKSVVEYLAFSTDNPTSIRNCIEIARVNSRSVRTALTSEMWDTINGAWIELQNVWLQGVRSRDHLSGFLRFVQETSLRFDGSAYRTMLRNDAYWFSRLGLHLERADNTARILDVKYHMLLPEEEHVGGPLDYYQWTSILRSVSALTAYHWVYRETLKPWLIADLLDPQQLAAALARQLLREPRAQPRPDRRRLWPPGSVPAPRPRHPQPAGPFEHGRHLPARPARIHRGVHQRQQPARRHHREAVFDMTA